MTSRERVISTIKFEKPDRLPKDLWWLPAVEMRQKKDLDELLAQITIDIATPDYTPGISERQKGQPTIIVPGSHPPISLPKAGEKYMDEWGSVWHIAEDGVVGEVKKPALDNISKLSSYSPPWDYIETTDLSKVNECCAKNDRFMLSGICARPFERLQFVRGTENFFIDLADGTGEIYRLRDMIHEFYLKYIKMWLMTDVDGILLMDDWGSKNSLLISPGTWRDFLKPLYREYCDLIHDQGKYVFFHSDGCIASIYEDLVELGIDVLNSELFSMNIEDLGEKFKGKITFWGEISRPLLYLGSPDDVKKAVRRVHRALYDESGGIIAQCEWGKDSPPENIKAVYETWDSVTEANK